MRLAVTAGSGALPRGSQRRARLAGERLAWVYPARSEIEFDGPFQLLVATILSAQSTDRMANRLAKLLLGRYPDARALASADPNEVERILRPIGFFRTKTRWLIASSQALVQRHGGHVPVSMPELLTLPGIGRKSANAILATGFGTPGVVTDRHLIRVAGRLRLVSAIRPELVEGQIQRLLPRRDWTPFSLRMTLHGRHVCVARRPRCEQCILNDFCPSSTTANWPKKARLELSLSLAGQAKAGPLAPVA
jgi:endonuclease-3